MAAEARYDGIAEWYDEWSAGSAESNAESLIELLGRGRGRCLEIGCGTSNYAEVIKATGRSYVGVDLSADQLRIARTREPHVVQADAARLPFADDSFETAVALWISTDVDDFRAVVREASRVLALGGTFVFYGVHPCFNGPCIETQADDSRVIHPTYRHAGWHAQSPWWGAAGIRSRVGMRHVPLAEFLTAFLAAGLRLTMITEPRAEPIPYVLGVAAELE